MKQFFFFVIFLVTLHSNSLARDKMIDIIHLKNGNFIKGIIIEQVPNVSFKISAECGNFFTFSIDEIEKITKEIIPEKTNWPDSRLGTTLGLSFANAPEEFNPAIGFNVFFHHPISRHFFVSLDFGWQFYKTVKTYSDSYYRTEQYFMNTPIAVGFNGILINKNNYICYLGIELGMMIEISYRTEIYNDPDNPSSSVRYYNKVYRAFTAQPVIGFSIPLISKINLDGSFKPLLIFSGEHDLLYSHNFNLGFSYRFDLR